MKRHDLDENINFSKLQHEFYTAKQADEKYSRENDAKFRAVRQKVGSYEEFQDIVAASHLKPLDRYDDITGGVAGVKQPWNRMCTSSNDDIDNTSKSETVSTNSNSLDVKPIKTRDDFLKAWKNLPNGDEQKHVHFLTSFDQDFLIQVFECDIPMNLMETAINSMNRLFSGESGNHSKSFIQILCAFTKSRRFSLSLKFLGKRDKENIRELLSNLKECGEVVDELLSIFHVSL